MKPGASVLLRVVDEQLQISKEFICNKQLLLSTMKYFSSLYTNEAQPIDITVNCSLQVFENLFQHMTRSPCSLALSMSNIASIVIASDFLQMESLVQDCVHFIRQNFAEFMQLPIDFSCVSDAIVDQLKTCSLDSVPSENPKSKAFIHRLEQVMLKQWYDQLIASGIQVRKCQNCRTIYDEKHEKHLFCEHNALNLGKHGQISAPHVAEDNFDFTHHVLTHSLHFDQICALLVSISQCHKCRVCGQMYYAHTAFECAFHPGVPQHLSNVSLFSCCQLPVFDPSISCVRGCARQAHIPTAKPDPLAQIYCPIIQSDLRVELLAPFFPTSCNFPLRRTLTLTFQNTQRTEAKTLDPAPKHVQWRALALQQSDRLFFDRIACELLSQRLN